MKRVDIWAATQFGRDRAIQPRSLPLKLSVKPFWLGYCQLSYFSRAVKMSKKPLCTGVCHIGGNLHEKRWTFWPQCNLVGIHHSNLAAGPLNSLDRQLVVYGKCLG